MTLSEASEIMPYFLLNKTSLTVNIKHLHDQSSIPCMSSTYN